MARLKFGAFLAPHHPIGEHPMLQFRRDLDLVEQLDALGYDEFWCGEHHSSGWETIASPEMFLAAAGERTKRIKLGTGVVSLPYHHPFNVAQRMVQLDHMTGGRAIFGSGPGALASDAHTLGIDPMTQRDRQDEAIAIIRRLFKGERITAKSDWFTMNDAALQILPLQEEMPFVVASQISPSGMTLAGKYGIGIISLGSMSTQGLMALPTQWGFAEDAAKKHGTTVSRSDWRVLLSWHIAETREQARREAGAGLMRWHNEYNVGTLQRPGLQPFTSPEDAVEKTAGGEGAASTIGTPDDLVKTIKCLMEVSGGVGTIVGFVHDWANPENTRRSWDMVARYVVPEINGYIDGFRKSQKFVIENRAVFERAGQAVMAKIMENDKAAAALPLTGPGRVAIPTINAPDMQKEAPKRKKEGGGRRLDRKSLPVIILHRLPGDRLQEPRGRLVDTREMGVADRGAPGPRGKHRTGRGIGSGQTRMALVRGMEIELGLLGDGAREGEARRNHQRIVFISRDRVGFGQWHGHLRLIGIGPRHEEHRSDTM